MSNPPDKWHHNVTKTCQYCGNDYTIKSSGRGNWSKAVPCCPECRQKVKEEEWEEKKNNKTHNPREVNANKCWVLVSAPKDCDFPIGFRVSDEELSYGRLFGSWDYGMVFEHKITRRRFSVQPELKV